jgi:hypothetical protein
MSNKVEFCLRKIILILYEKFRGIVMMIMMIVFGLSVIKTSKQQLLIFLILYLSKLSITFKAQILNPSPVCFCHMKTYPFITSK